MSGTGPGVCACVKDGGRIAPTVCSMQTKAAILWETNTPWSVEDIELDDPKEGEVRVKLAASGMCHSDEHLVTGDLPFELPMIGGHEGAGVVTKVGPGVSWLEEGDHVVFGFIPSCGRCPSCSTGHQNLCDLGAIMGAGLSMVALVPAIIMSTFQVGSPGAVHLAYVIAAIAGGLNLLNLLPVFPLDGGRVLRAVMQSMLPGHVRNAMFMVAGMVAIGGVVLHNPVLVAIAVVAFFQSARLGPAKQEVALMQPYAATMMCIAYVSLVAVHGVAMVQYWPSLG